MPEYLAPGVFVEETSFRAKSIEGVSTSTTGFVGPTRRGPTSGVPEVLTSFLDFQRIYGGLTDLDFGGTKRTNYLAHAVRSYFDNGGARLYVARVASSTAKPASAAIGTLTDTKFVSRTPGVCGNGKITVSVKTQQSTVAALKRGAPKGTVARIEDTVFVRGSDGLFRSGATVLSQPDATAAQIVTVSVTTEDGDGVSKTYDDLGLDAAHPRFIGSVLSKTPSRRSDQLEQLFAIELPATAPSASDLLDAFEDQTGPFELKNGEDGGAPAAGDYDAPLAALAGIEDVSIVAAPGSSADNNIRQAVHNKLISHCETRRAYRIAVLDTRQISATSEARDDRAPLDSTHAALYTPWIIVDNPLFKPGDLSQPREIALPPSGAVCGIYARNDVNRGVFKAPANEVVRGALRHDLEINFAQQETLNPIGINCLRFFPNRGNRVWGARTISSDPEWKYVNVRRYFNYLERSIDVGTQWAVFEPNGERLWANIRETISDFLISEWRSGALLGTSPKEAFFVRCDRSTMDQNDLDNGRLVCLIGVAVVKPAEFVIFRIGQKTADARN